MAEGINPFTKVRLWLMYEVIEIEALQETIYKRRQVLKTYRTTIEKVQDNFSELAKIKRGEYTLGTFYKSKESAKQVQKEMEDSRTKWMGDVINTRLHFQTVTIHLTKCVIPWFKM